MQMQRNREFKPEGELKIGGRFEGNSNYAENYLENQVQKNPQFRPHGELTLGNNRFEGISSYGA